MRAGGSAPGNDRAGCPERTDPRGTADPGEKRGQLQAGTQRDRAPEWRQADPPEAQLTPGVSRTVDAAWRERAHQPTSPRASEDKPWSPRVCHWVPK